MTFGITEALLFFGVAIALAYYLFIVPTAPAEDSDEAARPDPDLPNLSELSPGAARFFIARGRIDVLSLVATIVNLCCRGQVRWHEAGTPAARKARVIGLPKDRRDRDGNELTSEIFDSPHPGLSQAPSFDADAVPAEEAAILGSVFQTSEKSQDVFELDLHAASKRFARALRQRFPPNYMWPRQIFGFAGLIGSGLVVLAAGVASPMWRDFIGPAAGLYVFTLLIPIVLKRVARFADGSRRPLSGAFGGYVFGSLLVSIAIALAAASAGGIVSVLLLMVLGLLNGWFFVRLRVRSIPARNLGESIGALRDHMRAITAGDVVAPSTEEFERLLPYAMVFNLEDGWIRAWARVDRSIKKRRPQRRRLPKDMAAIEDRYYKDTRIGHQSYWPDWYDGPGLLCIRKARCSVSIADGLVIGRDRLPEEMREDLTRDKAIEIADREGKDLA